MSGSANHYRREAELVEQMAKQISPQADRQELLAQAQYLHQQADEIEALRAVADACSATT
jgi:hypothetical protein